MQRLRPDTAWLELGWFEPLVVNAYVHEDEDGVTLVDTGMPYNRRPLAAELRAAGYEPADVDRVLLTHYDLDHVGGVTRFDCPVYLGAADVALVRGDAAPPLSHPKGLFHRVARRAVDLRGCVLRAVEDGDRIGGFTAHHTPGHNPGHVAYVHDDGVAFVGDLLWETDGELTLPFWGDTYDGRVLRRSVRRLADRAGDVDVVCPGHGVPFVRRGGERLRALADELAREDA